MPTKYFHTAWQKKKVEDLEIFSSRLRLLFPRPAKLTLLPDIKAYIVAANPPIRLCNHVWLESCRDGRCVCPAVIGLGTGKTIVYRVSDG